MKKISFVYCNTFYVINNTNAQWYQIGENPVGVFSIVKFDDENIGWGCRNDPMKIFKTMDGGASWSVIFNLGSRLLQYFF